MNNSKVSIIIPTYKERDNISILVKEIHRFLCKMDYEIIIVDDNSQDGTSEVVKQLSEMYPVKIIVRKNKRGLATAVVEGFKYASGDIYIVMDADLQHPPDSITKLLDEIESGADIAIGSRYLTKNNCSGFSLYRKIISSGATLIARILLRKLSNIKDIQSGFFAVRKEVVKNVELNPIGYKILMEILAVGKYEYTKEVSYKFSERKNGKTKMNSKIMLQYIYHVFLLSYKSKEINRLAKYCIVGISGIILNCIILFTLTTFGLFYILSSLVAHEASIISNFMINNKWTFRGLTKNNDILSVSRRAFQYNMLKIGGIMMSICLLFVFTELLSINYIISNIFAIGFGVMWGYSTSVSIVWRN